MARRTIVLGMSIEPETGARLREMAWLQRRTVADLLRELVLETLARRDAAQIHDSERVTEHAATALKVLNGQETTNATA